MKRSVSGFINGYIDTCAVNIDPAVYQWIIVIFFRQPHPTEQGHLNTIWISNGANLYFWGYFIHRPDGVERAKLLTAAALWRRNLSPRARFCCCWSSKSWISARYFSNSFNMWPKLIESNEWNVIRRRRFNRHGRRLRRWNKSGTRREFWIWK